MPLQRFKASPPDPQNASRAAQYLRASTEHQKYSTQNQADTNLTYAEQHLLRIVRTYEDGGKSGLLLKGRTDLQKLLADVRSGDCDFNHILVYDVSRWGRFQDVDESAYYEFICKQAGRTVHYCAEQFANDGSMIAAIVKNLKRAMAADFSRDLSANVLAGQCRLARRGYHFGGPPGVGLRRLLIDEDGNRKFILKSRQYKSILTDRVILVPGPPEELALVRRIYRLFVFEKKSELTIARMLNREGALRSLNRNWSYDNIHEILTNEKYIGNCIFNRRSRRLRQRPVMNPPDAWIRQDGCVTPIVAKKMFERVQSIMAGRQKRRSDDYVLDELRDLLAERGRLSFGIIDAAKLSISSRAFSKRFRGIRNAYALIGYEQPPQGKLKHSDQYMLDYLREVLAKEGRLSHTLINASSSDGPKWWDYVRRFGCLSAPYRMIGYSQHHHGLGGRRKPIRHSQRV